MRNFYSKYTQPLDKTDIYPSIYYRKGEIKICNAVMPLGVCMVTV